MYTRFAAIPPGVLAIWSRSWIGWWSIVVLFPIVVWLWFNPRVFPRVDEPVKLASKGIFGGGFGRLPTIAFRPTTAPPSG